MKVVDLNLKSLEQEDSSTEEKNQLELEVSSIKAKKTPLSSKDQNRLIECLTKITNIQQEELSTQAKTILYLQNEVSTDCLTGARSRSCFNHDIEQYIATCNRYGEKGCLIFFDLNDFKDVNDSYGHEFGDEALVAFTKQIKSKIRASDEIYRYGGDEFFVILRNIDETLIKQKMARLQKRLNRIPLKLSNGTNLIISASLGYDVINGKKTSIEIIKTVDENMYQQKGRGTLYVRKYA